MRRFTAGLALLFSMGGALWSSSASADLPGRAYWSALEQLEASGVSAPVPPSDSRWLVRVPNAEEARRAGLIPVSRHWAVLVGERARAARFDAELSSSFSVRWAPPRELALDRLGPRIRLPEAQQSTGLTGAGVVVGLIDTGAEVTHSAFRKTDGRTRIAWLLRFGVQPRGLHPELEAEYGCSEEAPCAVFSREDIDASLEAQRSSAVLSDPDGHGTHVLSIAAGRSPTHPGVAPDAELIVAQLPTDSSGYSDADILLGAHFIFTRAEEMRLPAVLNVSLSSTIGAHDGSSGLEQGLAELTEQPGRALIVAAGNRGDLYTVPNQTELSPVGTHAETSLTGKDEARLSLFIPGQDEGIVEGFVYVWLTGDLGSEFSVSVADDRGQASPAVPPEKSFGWTPEELEGGESLAFIIAHSGRDPSSDIAASRGSAMVYCYGAWRGDRRFDLILRGRGKVRAWVQSQGALARETVGMQLARARRGGTIGIPATHPDLIAVGASVNRLEWTDFLGDTYSFSGQAEGELATFSAAGPTSPGVLKPDLIAPGDGVIAALARSADPRDSSDPTRSTFWGGAVCPEENTSCLVIDDEHAFASGTSMSAPVVSGAAALLLQRDPSLTQKDIRHLLQAGTKSVPGRTTTGIGAGELDVVASLLAQDRRETEQEALPVQRHSRIVLSDSYLQLGSEIGLRGLVVLRDRQDAPASGFDPSKLTLAVSGGHAEWTQITTGLAEFEVRGEHEVGLEEAGIEVRFDGETLARVSVPMGRDSLLAHLGYEARGGSCAWSAPRSSSASLAGLLVMALAVHVRRSRGRALAPSPQSRVR